MNGIIWEDLKNIYGRHYRWELLRDSTVLVTGGYGMLASYLVFFLIYLNEEHGMNITIVCQGRSREKMGGRFGDYLHRAYFHEAYFPLDKGISLPYQADYIFHAASPANPSYYGKSPVEVEEPNVLGTYYLLRYARECGAKGFLYFSSGDVYGQMEQQGADITEDMGGFVDPLDAHSCYGESKRMGETWCVSFFREYGVPAKIARIGHTYGPTMDIDKDPRVYAAFARDVLCGRDITMLSDGSARRPFCYIADAAAAFFLLLFEGECGEAYNVCNTGQFLSIAELAECLASLYPEKDIKVVKKERPPDSHYLEAAFNKANKPVETKLKNLGWECQYSVRDGFRRVFAAFSARDGEKEK